MNDSLTARPRAELTQQAGMGEQAFIWLRDTLGTVAPRDPRTRRLHPRRYRLELLAEHCDRDTFLIAVEWLGSETIPSVQTKRHYADDIRLWATVAHELAGLERLTLDAITPAMVSTWVKAQRALDRSPRTINRRLSALSSLIEYASHATGRLIPSPVTKHVRARVDQHDQTTATPVLSVPEFQAVVAAAATPREALVPVLLYTLAGRVSECCAAGLRHLKEVDGERRLDLTRKRGKGRSWPIPDQLGQLIDAATAGRTTGPLLLDDQDRPMDRHAVDRLLTRLGKKARVLEGRDLTPHVLRASRLTHMHRDKVPVEEIQEYADHSLIETTLRYIRRDQDAGLKREHAAKATAVYGHLVDRFTERTHS